MADYDLVIRGGTIADGSGGDLIDGDIAIASGRIATDCSNVSRKTSRQIAGEERRGSGIPA